MIKGVHGYFGSGKTLFIVMDAISNKEAKGSYVLSTLDTLNEHWFGEKKKSWDRINFDEIHRYALTGEALPYNKLFILGDEWQYYMDSRTFQDRDQLVSSYFLIQSRKRHVTLDYGTEMRGFNDLRVRQSTNIAVKCYKYHFNIQRHIDSLGNVCEYPVNKMGRLCYDDECELHHWFKYYVIHILLGKGKIIRLRNPEVIYPLYSTGEVNTPLTTYAEDTVQEMVKMISSGQKV